MAATVAGLVVTVLLVVLANLQYTHNEKRLLDLRVRELAAVLAQAGSNVRSPMASAAALAEATNGNPRKFSRFVAPYVGAPPKGQFESMSLWRLRRVGRGPIVTVGVRPALRATPGVERAFFARAALTPKLSVIGLTPPTLMRLGYAQTSGRPGQRFIVYAESALPPNRRSRLERNTAFSDLNYVLYLGPAKRPADLLLTSVSNLPLRGRQAGSVIPFGSTFLTLVVAPRVPLSGTLPQRLPWIIAIVGALLALGVGALTTRLIQRRRAAEQLADRLEHALDENQRLYAEQRTIAQTLQHALLPERLPKLQGAEASALYEAGERGIEVGGDWYDVIPLDDQKLLVVVGDVSGRGLRAATTMASLRFAIHAYAAQNDPPVAILAKLSKILDVTSGGQLATVLCALIDVPSRELTVASAGHLPPLLLSSGRGEYVEGQVGLPVGVEQDASYIATTITAPPSATLLAFTDGLVERRGEALDNGLARLREAAVSNHATLPDLLDRIIAEMRPGPSEDDTAIVGLRWSS